MKNALKNPRNFGALFGGSEKIPQNSRQISHNISLPKILKKSPTSFCRSAGRSFLFKCYIHSIQVRLVIITSTLTSKQKTESGGVQSTGASHRTDATREDKYEAFPLQEIRWQNVQWAQSQTSKMAEQSIENRQTFDAFWGGSEM